MLFLPFGRSYSVVDTLYIGCDREAGRGLTVPKFPSHDTFALNIGGVL